MVLTHVKIVRTVRNGSPVPESSQIEILGGLRLRELRGFQTEAIVGLEVALLQDFQNNQYFSFTLNRSSVAEFVERNRLKGNWFNIVKNNQDKAEVQFSDLSEKESFVKLLKDSAAAGVINPQDVD